MLIKQINGSISLNQDHKTFLESLKPYQGIYWETPPKVRGNLKRIKELKEYIKKQLEDIQGNECAYCGLAFDETSSSEIEHIAPKGKKKDKLKDLYPHFMFTENNLTLACHLCNGFEKKGIEETIDVEDIIYENCTFTIVHPYFDNPDEHYDWANNAKQVLIQWQTNKGKKSIELFKLDSEAHSDARGKKVMHQLFNLPEDALKRYNEVKKYEKEKIGGQ